MIRAEGALAAIGGGVESISLVQNAHMNMHRARDPWLSTHGEGTYMTMIQTAEVVAQRYGVTRDAQDEFALASQQRTAAAIAAGVFDEEIAPLQVNQTAYDRDTGSPHTIEVHATTDEGPRPSTTLEATPQPEPVAGPDSSVTAGNASQLSDGASANVLMEAREVERRGLTPLRILRGVTVSGCSPDEMGIGPVVAVPRLLSRHGLTVDGIDVWEINEAFASQAIYCRDRLGIDPAKLNVNGGAIALGHPFGMTGSRMVGHVLLEGRRTGATINIVAYIEPVRTTVDLIWRMAT